MSCGPLSLLVAGDPDESGIVAFGVVLRRCLLDGAEGRLMPEEFTTLPGQLLQLDGFKVAIGLCLHASISRSDSSFVHRLLLRHNLLPPRLLQVKVERLCLYQPGQLVLYVLRLPVVERVSLPQ